MAEINLLDRYPRSSRPIDERAASVTEADRAIARRFGQEYFDGTRLQGYGGYNYHPRFWQETVRRFRDHYGLADGARILDVGCAKGFMLHDFKALMPKARFAGLDVSHYAVRQAPEDVRPLLCVGDARDLPFDDDAFDLVISINTVHNLPREALISALREIRRVSARHAFITVDAYRTDAERERLVKWNLTALTWMHVNEWPDVFRAAGYDADYHWFIAE